MSGPAGIRIATGEELEACIRVRREVFVEGQGVPEAEEIDGRDPGCTHFVAVDEVVVGTVRLRIEGTARLERLAVLPGHRGRGIGTGLALALEREARRLGHGEVLLGAQLGAVAFYEALGYVAEGEVYDDAGIPHRRMRRSLARPRAVVAWSTGKDAAFALARARARLDVTGILTTLTSAFGRVSMHAVREEILAMQARALGLRSKVVRIPHPCPDEVYARSMEEALGELSGRGVTHVVFGDLFLEDVRAYRERNLARAGMQGDFPLWGSDTAELAEEMIESGVRARITCLDPRRIDPSLAGRAWNRDLIAHLPAPVDPCGENGEFHTLVTHGPMFRDPVDVVPGEVVEREGYVFADMVPVRR